MSDFHQGDVGTTGSTQQQKEMKCYYEHYLGKSHQRKVEWKKVDVQQHMLRVVYLCKILEETKIFSDKNKISVFLGQQK